MDITFNDLTTEEFFAIAKALMDMKNEIKVLSPKADIEKPMVEPTPIVKEKPKANPPIEKWVNAKELATALGITQSNFPRYVRKGMPCRKNADNRIEYPLNECKEWKAKNIRSEFYTSHKDVKAKSEPSDFVKWQKDIFALIDEHNLDRGKTCSKVLNIMNSKYGVVWDQVKKDAWKENHLNCRRTMEACYWLQTTQPTYNRMFEGILGNVLNGKEV